MSPPVVSPAKAAALRRRMAALAVREEDLAERFIRGGGRGGQKINKTSSCVVLRHAPTGIEVRCQQERSQALNRFLARRELCEKIAERVRGEASARRQAAEKIRRQKRRRSRRQKERMLADKRKHSERKQARAPVVTDD